MALIYKYFCFINGWYFPLYLEKERDIEWEIERYRYRVRERERNMEREVFCGFGEKRPTHNKRYAVDGMSNSTSTYHSKITINGTLNRVCQFLRNWWRLENCQVSHFISRIIRTSKTKRLFPIFLFFTIDAAHLIPLHSIQAGKWILQACSRIWI